MKPSNEVLVVELGRLLRDAQLAYAEYELRRTQYAADDGPEGLPEYVGWPEWYAEYMLDHRLFELLVPDAPTLGSMRVPVFSEQDAADRRKFPGDTTCDYLCGDSIALDG
jgi:hypothetical protein